jgi:hypothetical protein
MSNELFDAIAQAGLELDQLETDNQVTDEATDENTELVDEEVVEGEEDSEENLEDTDNDDKNFVVKVNGETFEVTLEELKSGYQRQADYTREKQALKHEYEKFEEIKKQNSTELEALGELTSLWEESPVTLLSNFALNTQNVTETVAYLIQDLAAQGALERDFLEMFGVTPEIQREWARSKEVETLRSKNTRTVSKRDEEFENTKMELEVQKAIAEYDKQIDDIIETESMNFNTKQRAAFRQELARYASDNDISNLKVAYKAFKYEESKKNKALVAKTAERTKAKKAATAVTRSGSGEGAPIQDNTDLKSVIAQVMKELG